MTAALRLAYEDHTAAPLAGESVLDTLLRVGLPVSFSCKSGVCRACMMRCVTGPVPERAQRGLPEHLREQRYLLACQCQPEGSMVLAPRRAQDMLTLCMVAAASGHGSGELTLELEPATELKYATGQTLHLLLPGVAPEHEPVLRLVSDPAQDYLLRAVLPWPAAQPLPEALAPDAPFGAEITVRGPFGAQAAPTAPVLAEELGPPPPDPALWDELDQGRTARRVLEAFYAKVYADAQLAPFFEGVTIERAIEKQYSFLMQHFTGQKCYFGNRPRNAHHWMIITEALFDYRQALMVQTLREHGLTEDQIARWTSFEEHYRREMVKSAPWPRQVGDQLLDTETFETAVLTDATVCDHCGDEVPAGTEVRFHRRLGKVGCPRCQQGVAA